MGFAKESVIDLFWAAIDSQSRSASGGIFSTTIRPSRRRKLYCEIVRPLSLQIPSADKIAEPSHSPPRLPEPNARPSLLHALIDDVIPNLVKPR